jgi:hypothetical protein
LNAMSDCAHQCRYGIEPSRIWTNVATRTRAARVMATTTARRA